MNAVVTIAVGNQYKEIALYTHGSIRNYASKVGAEFICIDESECSSPHWDKFRIYSLLNKYKRILYIDTDVIIRDDCPNLFDLVPEDKLGLFNEASFTDGRVVAFNKACEEYNIKLDTWNGCYYNTGIMVISQVHKYLFKKPDKEIFNFYEQSYLNVIIAKNKVPIFSLPYSFNRMTCMDRFTGEERFASYIIHYAGYPSLEFVTSLIKSDMVRWNLDFGSYNYKRHILVDVQGGLGDQICAEPAIRYMINNVYPGDDVIVKTHFPRIFKHLNVPVFEHDDFVYKQDTPYYHIISLPGPETVMWSCVSNLLCHTVDYAAMALLRRTLPNKDKEIILKVTEEDINKVKEVIGNIDLNNLILVHCGRHWQSKTFPTSWWQGVIDGIHKEVQVCLIGKEDDTRGTANVEVRDGMIDTRNLLDIGALFAIISMSKLVLSNDSAPIHIAGAFDTNIVLIPTCKHPDHLLPWRKGTQCYKTQSLYKRLTLDNCDSRPTCIHGSSAEFVVGNILDYIPDPIQVINKVISMVES